VKFLSKHIERMILLVLVIIAFFLWLSLAHWQRLFNRVPDIAFAVPVFERLNFEADANSSPSLPHLKVIYLPGLTEEQQKILQQRGFPLFEYSGRWLLGPYLQQKEAEDTSKQVTQITHNPVTMSDYSLFAQ
jgi:hypothetical protein